MSSVVEHTDCPVCLKVYNKPRTLPCLHTFCEECINSAIVKRLAGDKWEVHCTLCRQPNLETVGNTSPEEWVDTLPLSPVFLPNMQSQAAESETGISCGSKACREKNVVAYCNGCNFMLCDKCVESHDKFPALKSHKIASLSDSMSMNALPLDLGVVERCKEHPEDRVDFLCEKHNVLCCGTCAFRHHRDCGAKDIGTIGKDVKDNGQAKTLQRKMVSLQNRIGHISKEVQQNSSDIDKQTDALTVALEDIQDSINTMLNQLKEKVTCDGKRLQQEEQTRITDIVSKCRVLLTAIGGSYSMLDCVLERGTDNQLLVAYRQIQAHVKRYLRDFDTDLGDSQTTDLQLRVSGVLQAFRDSKEPLGTIKLTKTKIKIESRDSSAE